MPFDRLLAIRLGTKTIKLIENQEFGFMVGVKLHALKGGAYGAPAGQGDALVKVPLEAVARNSRLVPLNHPLMKSARSVGTSFGD